MFFGDATMYDIFRTGQSIKKYLNRTVDSGRLFMYSDIKNVPCELIP